MKKNIISFGLLILIVAVIPLLALIVSPIGNSRKVIQPTVPETAQTVAQDTTNASSSPTDENTFFRIYDNSLKKIITVSDSDFCIGATATETDTTIPHEALKAEIVAIHTYYSYLRQQSRNEKKEFDFECNSNTWKVYVSESQLREKLRDTFDDDYYTIKNAVDEVSNLFVLFDGKLCMTSYFDISVGNTFSYNEIFQENIPYLYSVPSPFDTLANNYKTQVILPFDEFNKKFAEHFSDYQPTDDHTQNLKDIVRSENGAVTSVTVGNKKTDGKQLSSVLNLRSSSFDVEFKNNQYIFDVYGYGDNIGLSKCGACKLAEQGYTFTEILQYYYTDVTVSPL